MTQADVHGRLALAVLASDERIRAAIELARAAPEGKAADPLTALMPRRGPRWSDTDLGTDADARRDVLSVASRRLLAADLRWAGEDIRPVLEGLAEQANDGLLGWLQLIFDRFNLRIRFDTEPVIDLSCLHGWLTCAEKIDPDSLICFVFATNFGPSRLDELTDWHVIARIADRDLQRLTAQGVSDLHIHQGALRNAQSRWQELISGNAVIADALVEADPVERERVSAIAAALADTTSALGRYYPKLEPEAFGVVDPQRNLKRMRAERRMLVRAFAAIDTFLKQRAWPDAIKLEHELDVYIHTKSRFMQRRMQSVMTNPGLNIFRRAFASMRLPGPRPTQAMQGVAHHDSLLYLLQSGDLRHAELRFALPDTRARTVAQMMQTWEEAEKDYQVGWKFPMADIRFAIHFKRSLDVREGIATLTGMRELRKKIADEAAALHEFRRTLSHTSDRHLVSRIARVDFAGQERDVPPDAAVFAMNLVRGDAASLQLLKQDVDPHIYERWLQIAASSDRDRPALPALGLTCHAGEDFAHPLEGVFAMTRAAKCLKMREGDTIGHGLAAGADVEKFNRERAAHVLTEAGQQFDALLWLYIEMMKSGTENFGALVIELEEWLWTTLAALYPGMHLPPSLMMLADIGEHRAGPVWERNGQRWRENEKVPARCFADREMHDHDTFKERARRVALAELYAKLLPAVQWAQTKVVQDLSQSGILFEFNPSSNWRISGATEPREIPFIPLLVRHKNLILATINTDNPGVFGTRIENEYAIVFQGLRDAGVGREEALTMLRRMRDNGMRRVYWPRVL